MGQWNGLVGKGQLLVNLMMGVPHGGRRELNPAEGLDVLVKLVNLSYMARYVLANCLLKLYTVLCCLKQM